MTLRRFDAITTLTFDIFGTVLDLTGSLEGPTGRFLNELGSDMSGAEFYAQWRARQRIEQFQDSLMGLGHSGYLETCRRALVYTLRMNGIRFRSDEQAAESHEGVAVPESTLGRAGGSESVEVPVQTGRSIQRRAGLSGPPRAEPDRVRVRRDHIG